MPSITSLFHPTYLGRQQDYSLWRDTFDGGQDYLNAYLKRFSKREDEADFSTRKFMTPLATYARSAIIEVRNSIFQRLAGVSRFGGSLNYQQAVNGQKGGVDNRGNSMTAFLGQEVLDELMVMSAVGVYIDAPSTASSAALGDDQHKSYIYAYKIEQIKNWVKNNPEHPSEYQSITLEESENTFDAEWGMPNGSKKRTRHVWIGENGKVQVQFHYADDAADVQPVIELNLTRIPFVLFDLRASLISEVCGHQIALLNLGSSNVAYAMNAGFSIYTEQSDSQSVGQHLKKAANASGTASAGGQGANDTEIQVGTFRGRRYDVGNERPGFINPSSEPLKASMELCQQLKADIRELIQLSVINLGTSASAESKSMDGMGLEAGLSMIGQVLEAGERLIAEHWAAYENAKKPKVATISYPQRWSLKSDAEQIKDATDLHALIGKLTSKQAKKETSKILVLALLGKKVSADTMATIVAEIEKANFTTSDPEIIKMAKEQGLLSAATGAETLGFDKDEATKAESEHAARLTEIAKHQIPGGIQGVPDTQAGANANKQAQATNPDKQTEPKATRGKGAI